MEISALAAALAAALAGGITAALRKDLELSPPRLALVGGLLALAALTLLTATGRPLGAPALALAVFLPPLALIDARRGLLPDPLTLSLIGVALIVAHLSGYLFAAALGGAVGYAAFWSFGVLWRKARGVEALGLGDAKLFAGIGAALGFRALPEVMFLGAVFGVLGGLAMAGAQGRAPGRHDELPFGPALAVGAWVYLMWGPFLAG